MLTNICRDSSRAVIQCRGIVTVTWPSEFSLPSSFQSVGERPCETSAAIARTQTETAWLLRFDYGRSRILLTGDLNAAAQRKLLEDYDGDRLEFKCDVAKACHHGSADVSYEFLAALEPAVTIISSGDNEGHDHPRPSVVAASATTGYLSLEDDELTSPLVYSTEAGKKCQLWGAPEDHAGRFDHRERKHSSKRPHRVHGDEIRRSVAENS